MRLVTCTSLVLMRFDVFVCVSLLCTEHAVLLLRDDSSLQLSELEMEYFVCPQAMNTHTHTVYKIDSSISLTLTNDPKGV